MRPTLTVDDLPHRTLADAVFVSQAALCVVTIGILAANLPHVVSGYLGAYVVLPTLAFAGLPLLAVWQAVRRQMLVGAPRDDAVDGGMTHAERFREFTVRGATGISSADFHGFLVRQGCVHTARALTERLMVVAHRLFSALPRLFEVLAVVAQMQVVRVYARLSSAVVQYKGAVGDLVSVDLPRDPMGTPQPAVASRVSYDAVPGLLGGGLPKPTSRIGVPRDLLKESLFERDGVELRVPRTSAPRVKGLSAFVARVIAHNTGKLPNNPGRGNSNADGSRTGTRWVEKTRPVDDTTLFIRWSED